MIFRRKPLALPLSLIIYLIFFDRYNMGLPFCIGLKSEGRG